MNVIPPSAPESVPTPRPRLLFIVESGTDVRMIDGLARHFEVTVFARSIPGGAAVNHKPSSPVRIIEGPPGRWPFAWAAAGWVRRLTARDRAAILVQNEGLTTLLVHLLTSPGAGSRTVLLCSPAVDYYACRRNNPTPAKPYRAAEHTTVRALALANARQVRHYVVLSDFLRRQTAARRPRGRIDVIPVYGVDTAVFAPPARLRNDLRAQLDLPRDGRILLHSSRVAPEKDHVTLLEAFSRLARAHADAWLLHLSGEYERLAAAADAAGCEKRVLARPAVHPVQALPEFYQACDLCVQTSHAEGLGFSVLEALSCGTPVVATGIGGLMETIVPGISGWSCRPSDVTHLRAVLQQALYDRQEESIRMARAGRRLVMKRYEAAPAFAALARAIAQAETSANYRRPFDFARSPRGSEAVEQTVALDEPSRSSIP